jgi:SAM-dependent methyltransferase
VKEDNANVSQWSQSAPYWEKHRENIRKMFFPITTALIADAQVTRGHKVLDVATGPGEPALSIAQLVGPEGEVWGIDPAPEMVASARRAAGNYGFGNVHFEVAFADHLSFESDTFDAAVSRFGVMFFPSPVDGLREMLRVLKPNRKLGVAVWHFAEHNPFHYILSRVIERYVESPPTPPDSPDAFRFAGSGKLLEIFKNAGAVESSERLLQFRIEAPVSVEDFWVLRSEMSDKLRSKLAVLSAEQVAEVRSQVIDALGEYATDLGLSFPAQVLIVSGRKK